MTVTGAIAPDERASITAAFGRPQPPLPPSRWAMPDPEIADETGFVGAGADLEPDTLVTAYRAGLFPMPLGSRARRRGLIGWWSPDPRGIVPLDGLHVSRSLRRSCRHLHVGIDRAFTDVMLGCADPTRPHGWINGDIVEAYTHLHRLGYAHSIEVRDPSGALVGGLYGVRIARFFAGESMYHVTRDASKVALVAIVEAMREAGMTLFDVQWTTPHLTSLGAVDIPRADYLRRLDEATR